MKYLKSLGLIVVLAAMFATCAAYASATTLTSSSGSTPSFSLSSEGHVVIDNPIAKIECAVSMAGKAESHSGGVTVTGNLSSLSFTGCTNSWHLTVVSAGSFSLHATSGGNATWTSSGVNVEATRFGIICRYTTASTDFGTLTNGEHATLDLSSAVPVEGSALCDVGTNTATGSLKMTSPTNVSVDP